MLQMFPDSVDYNVVSGDLVGLVAERAVIYVMLVILGCCAIQLQAEILRAIGIPGDIITYILMAELWVYAYMPPLLAVRP